MTRSDRWESGRRIGAVHRPISCRYSGEFASPEGEGRAVPSASAMSVVPEASAFAMRSDGLRRDVPPRLWLFRYSSVPMDGSSTDYYDLLPSAANV
jgi:hypothetical protein